ncbi:MAG: ABC transporter ATP-binding protein [Dehalococcoidia bacterium]|nr:ABC transporter ATP-binding protein [Dehalococcoidia bacterium]
MLEVRDLKKHFRIRHNPLARLRGHRDHIVRAIDGVTFEICEGEVLGLVGESGCGKTTLAKTVLRLYLPTNGDVLFRGQSVFGMGRNELKQLRREAQIVFQDSNSTLDPRMNARHMLEEPLLLHRMGQRSERRQRIASMMEKVMLSPAFLKRHPAELSGGQRQRLSMARALIIEPRLVIADEPLAGLDPIVSTQLLDLMLCLKREMGLTYLFISHDLSTVTYASDRIAVMYKGRIVEIIDGERFQSGALHPYTRFLQSPERLPVESEVNGDIHFRHGNGGKGCVFHEKCPNRTSICTESSPGLRDIAPGHKVACHLVN